ncbi:hypothetical protein NEMBOFW57_000337 [Staphylotrichum longicolle]|uniref:Uncharacterized protein n=1 Tax=Staphylotrichum longicolle TaxID=669026 RepID=A0AAD4EZH2_9PEZI|nr:hypothetical protein NEMBOFW57_000337 [Staphylotrichum longicolle]
MEPQDIALSYEDIDSFVANTASYLELRSLTLHLTQPTLVSHEPQDVEASNAQVEEALTRLAGAIARLQTLRAFSLYVPPHNTGHHFDISQTAIASLIESLPQSCVSLEIDTAGLDHATGFGTPVHLCETLRAVLPQLRHARLSLRTMCSSLFGTGPALPQNLKDATASYTPISLPSMQALLVNCRRAWGTAPICASAAANSVSTIPTPTTPTPDAWDAVTRGLHALAAAPRGRVRPDGASLCVLTSTPPQDSADKSRYTTLIRADAARRTAHAFPLALVARGPPAAAAAWLMRTPGAPEGREVIASDTAALVAAAEGEAAGWAATTTAAAVANELPVRLPVPVAAEWGLEVRALPLEEVGVWRAANPRKMHLLWYNEHLSGERLLDGEVLVSDFGYLETPL